MTPTWTIEGALRVVRAVQPATRHFGYHLALGGGVLNKGESEKDLDLYFLPLGGFGVREGKEHDPDMMLSYLTKLWGASEPLSQDNYDDKETQSFYKHAVKFTRMGGVNKDVKQRIDCFIF